LKALSQLGHDENETTLKYTTNVSMRQYAEYKEMAKNYRPQQNCLGSHIGLLFDTFQQSLRSKSSTNELDIYSEDWIKEFWRHVVDESIKLHKTMETNDVFYPFCIPSGKKCQKNEFLFHFCHSNIGRMESSLTEDKLIKIKSYYTSGMYSLALGYRKFCWFANLIATIDGTLSWAITYNSNFIKNEIIDLIIDNILKLISVVCDLEEIKR
jgi:hypothetical protein